MGQFLEDDFHECLRPLVAPYLSQSDQRICCICSPERAVPACLASSPPHKKNGLRGDSQENKMRAVCIMRACSVHRACVHTSCTRGKFWLP